MRPLSLRSGALVTAVVLGGALGLAACSSSPSNSSSNTTTSSSGGTGAGPTTTTAPPAGNATAPIPAGDLSAAGTAGSAPTVTVPKSSPPASLESSDLITGSGPGAANGNKLTVQYVLATYSSGKVVQSSWTSQPFSFTLGVTQLIKGWTTGMVGMKAGGRRELIIPPSFGYGAQSPGPGIAANDTLVFVIDLQRIG